MIDEKTIVVQRYKDCKTERQKYISLWRDINKYVSLATDVNSNFEDTGTEQKQRDSYINDPTAYISTTQLADYLIGLIWGMGDEVFDLVPNDYIKEQIEDETEVADFYNYATNIASREINHPEAGFISCLNSFIQGQITYGTSGTGCYPSKDYIDGKADNILQFNRYGVDNCCIDEGANGKINVIFSVRNWRLARIIDEFAVKNEKVDEELLSKLPKDIKDAYTKKEYNKKFKIVHGILPHKDYSVGKIGVMGTKYKGFWLLETDKTVFFEENYRELPAAICRAIKLENQVYGASYSSMSISSIKLLNYAAGKGIRSIEKLTDPPHGAYSGSLQAGEVIDSSANALNIFKNDSSSNKPPIFPLSDLGDISALLQLLIPKAEQNIATIFKIDRLLDFNAQVSMTATESMQRFNIKSKSEIGIIIQILNEYLLPLLHRAISLLEEAEVFGVLPNTEEAQKREFIGQGHTVIPDAVAMAMQNGKRWYDIKFKNSISQILNAEKFEWLSKFLMTYAQMLQLNPDLQLAVKPYDLLAFVKEILNLGNESFMLSESEFKKAIEAMQQQQQQMMQLQAENMGSNTVRNLAGAEKDAKQSRESV